MNELSVSALKGKERTLLLRYEGYKKPKEKKESWVPPKPKHSIHVVNSMAIKSGMSYGKFVALMHQKGVKL